MAKSPTFPDCFDEAKTITIAWLRQLGYLRPGLIVRRGSLHWKRNGQPSGWINIDVNAVERFVELRYDVKRQFETSARSIEYRIRLESRTSNLGIGLVWYFICPVTHKRCRTLYGIGDYFLSRSAYPSAMYSSQTESKLTRSLLQTFRYLDLAREFKSKRYARTMYKGKLTKRFARLLDKQARSFNPYAIRRILRF